ncbi:MAG: hypothetical protein ABIU87_12735 [Ornithinibacter sp.]
MTERQRFQGRIAGVGSTSGVRVVLGWWHQSPFGAFADAMVERPDGHRVLLAPSQQVADFVSATYVFDEVRIEPIEVEARVGTSSPASGSQRERRPRARRAREGSSRTVATWQVDSPSLHLDLTVGERTGVGRLLRVVPRRLATSPLWATAIDPVARVAMRGVRTRGVARAGRREYYGALDAQAVTAASGRLDGIPLGDLAPVDPPCRFGFSSTPRRPSVTDVVTTIIDT